MALFKQLGSDFTIVMVISFLKVLFSHLIEFNEFPECSLSEECVVCWRKSRADQNNGRYPSGAYSVPLENSDSAKFIKHLVRLDQLLCAFVSKYVDLAAFYPRI